MTVVGRHKDFRIPHLAQDRRHPVDKARSAHKERICRAVEEHRTVGIEAMEQAGCVTEPASSLVGLPSPIATLSRSGRTGTRLTR